MRIARALLDQIVAQARAEAPNECCGLVSARDGEAVAVLPARNAAASAQHYLMDAEDQLRHQQAIDDAGLDLGAIYHSHPHSRPEPSPTDVKLAAYPESLYLIVGLAADEPEVRAWRIVDGNVSEAELDVR